MQPFRFKKFLVHQENTAMKVGTDGVLLGAWSSVNEGNILDIGTGTGLIALMVAQRTNFAHIDALELEINAFEEAKKNIQECSWSDRIKVYHKSLQSYHPEKKYDFILSNPPFFIHSTKSPNINRKTARHTDSLSFCDLITNTKRLLKPNGIFSLILPASEADNFIDLAKNKGLFLNRKCGVKPNLKKTEKRILMTFSFTSKPTIQECITIETDKRHQYSKEYRYLTKDFYLNF